MIREKRNFLVPITYKLDFRVLGLEVIRFVGQKNVNGLRYRRRVGRSAQQARKIITTSN